MEENVQQWLRSAEADRALDKFTPEEKPVVTNMLRIVGLQAKRVLLHREEAVRLGENLPLLREAVRQGLTDVQYLLCLGEEEIDARTAETWSAEELSDPLLALRRISSWVLPPERRDTLGAEVLQKLSAELPFYERQFHGKAITGLLHGSLFFGDPSDHPDVDFDFIASSRQDMHPALPKIEEELTDAMGIRVETSIIDLRILEEALEQIEQGQHAAMHSGSLASCAILLCSELIALPGAKHELIKEHIDMLKEEILTLATTHPGFRLLLIAQFIDMEYSRKEKARRTRPTA